MTGDFSQLLLGLCAGSMFAMAAAMLRAPRRTARWSGFAFFFTGAVFAIKLWGDASGAFSPLIKSVINLTSLTSVSWFWMMVMALFADCEEYHPRVFAAPAALIVIGVLYQFPPHPPHVLLIAAGSLTQAALAVAALAVVLRSWTGDLVESRRRLRGPFMVAVAIYILSLNGFDLWDMVGAVPEWYPMFNAALLAGLTLCGAFTFLDPRSAMFGVAPASLPARAPDAVARQASAAEPAAIASNSTAPTLDRAARADLDRLEQLMSKDQVWREEGLTIAGLALRVGVPENQLRRLINDCLGYRNFPSYVNAHRIAAAKTRLADPGESRVSISAIAYDIGFASLGPFNRAFKEVLGVSPSEWRRSALENPSPIPEPA